MIGRAVASVGSRRLVQAPNYDRADFPTAIASNTQEHTNDLAQLEQLAGNIVILLR